MAKRDWLTGQSLEREGPNPIAGFLAGLMQAQSQKQQQADAERREQQKQAMMQIQDGRTMLEKAAQMDPALWGDGDFITAWKTGSLDYLAQSGWKPPATAKTYNDQNVGGNIVRLDPETGTYKTVYEGKPSAPEYKYVMLPWGNGQRQGRVGPNGYEIQDNKGQWVPFSGVTPGKPEGGGEKPTDPSKVKYQNNFTDENGIVWRISYNADGDEVKRVKVGKAKDSGDDIGNLLNPPQKQPGLLSTIGSILGSFFENDDEDELDKFRKSLQ